MADMHTASLCLEALVFTQFDIYNEIYLKVLSFKIL